MPLSDFHDPAGADPGLRDVLWSLLGAQPPFNVATVPNLVIPFHKRDVAFSLYLALDLATQRFLISFDRQEVVGTLLLEMPKNGRWVWSASAWMRTPSRSSSPSHSRSTAHSWFVAVGISGLVDRHTECGRIQRDLGNERLATIGCRHDRPAQGLADTDQLIKIRCATRDLGNRPVTDCSAKRRHVHLLVEVAERGIRVWSLELPAERLGKYGLVADGESFQIL